MNTSRKELPEVSQEGLRLFAAYSRWYLRRHFHSVRVLREALPHPPEDRSIVIHLNHAAWWDPLVCLRLAREWFPDLQSFAPIDSRSLEKYRFFERLGFYGVEQGSARGAAAFLRTSCAILQSDRNVIWMTPQGRFADVRERPPRLQPGIGSLARHSPETVFVPLAIEYAFWTEARPEILAAFGEPVLPADSASAGGQDWTARFADSLEQTQDRLAAASLRRSAGDWLTLDKGASGISAVYDLWRWARARVQGGRFERGHQQEETA